ncbi:MAG: 4-hydroxy-tetrahydrodipicolinate reductase [Spirochaetales bacterium]|nr:4-hydroxy-tetrahydrodipicolinate reductase [Spirochaetales bacterium]
MKAIILGYGKMGREVETMLHQKKHEVAARIDSIIGDADARALTKELALKADVVIEFALAEAIEERVSSYARFNIPAVIATTGWNNQLAQVKDIVENSSIGVVYGSNFSVGMNIFFQLIKQAATIFNLSPEYDIMAYEIHHKRKKDSPSGTAKTIGSLILENHEQKNSLVEDKLDRAPETGELHFASVRGGYVPGIHTVLFDSAADTIELTHNARNRSGLAAGAVLAAEWIIGKKGFFEFKDIFNQILKH